MKMNIKELYKIEKRDPVSITEWLKLQGFKDQYIELALAEFAEKLANGERFGYVNEISVLSNRIRDRVRELNLQEAENLVGRLGKFEIKNDSFFKKIWKWFK